MNPVAKTLTIEQQKKAPKQLKSHTFVKNDYQHAVTHNVSWQDQVVTVLPLVLFIVTLIQAVSLYKFFDLSIYNNQSVELVSGSINTLWEKLFVFDSEAVVLINIAGLIGFATERKWCFNVILFAGCVSVFNGIVMLNLIAVLAGLMWIILLLHIRKQFV